MSDKIRKFISQFLLLLLTLVMFFPLYTVFIMSTYYSEDIFKYIPILPSDYFMENLKVVLSNNYFQSYANSILVSFFSVIICVTISALIGFALAKYEFKGKKLILSSILLVMMIPGQISMIGYMIEMREMGINNTLLPLILTWTANPLGAFLMTQFIRDSVPNEILESARIDGCGELKTFARIVVPCIKPGILTLATMVFLWSWNSYVLPLVLVNKQELFTIPLMVSTLSNQFRTDYGAIMCALSISIFPVIILFACTSKTFIRGISAGAVKG